AAAHLLLVEAAAVRSLSQRADRPGLCALVFFQAEDGIRDYKVTGVQTCALPISTRLRPRCVRAATTRRARSTATTRHRAATTWRSEERRVGKECRARWQPQPPRKSRGHR